MTILTSESGSERKFYSKFMYDIKFSEYFSKSAKIGKILKMGKNWQKLQIQSCLWLLWPQNRVQSINFPSNPCTTLNFLAEFLTRSENLMSYMNLKENWCFEPDSEVKINMNSLKMAVSVVFWSVKIRQIGPFLLFFAAPVSSNKNTGISHNLVPLKSWFFRFLHMFTYEP